MSYAILILLNKKFWRQKFNQQVEDEKYMRREIYEQN